MIETYEELVKDSNGIFFYLNKISALPFTNNEVNISELDEVYLFKFGEQLLFRKVRNLLEEHSKEETLEKLARIIKTQYSEKWKKNYSTFLSDYKLGVKEIVQYNQTNKDVSNQLNKLSAFDSDELVVNDGNELNINKDLKRDVSTINMDKLITDMEKLQDNFIYDMIFKDIRSTINLKIY